MHTLVLKTRLYQENPWLAVSFYRAFCRARDMAYRSMYDTDALTVSLPWVIDEVEATRRIFGPQIWDYSIEGSRPTLEALVTYLDEQQLTRRRMSVEELFVPEHRPRSRRLFAGHGRGLIAGKPCGIEASAFAVAQRRAAFYKCRCRINSAPGAGVTPAK